MKRIFSWILFALSLAILAFDAYFAVSVGIECMIMEDEILASGGSGIDLWGVPWDILIMGTFLISLLGAIISSIASALIQKTVAKGISLAVMCMFWLGVLGCVAFVIM